MIRAGAASAPNTTFRAGLPLYFDVFDDPHRAFRIICEVTSRFKLSALSSEEPSEAKVILQHLGAGPLEMLLVTAGDRFIKLVEIEVKRDPKFRWLLGCVWQGNISDEVWQRVKDCSRA